MKATEFQFRPRFWIIGAIFWFGFLLYRVDQLNMAQFLVNRTVGENSPHADSVARSLLLFAAFLVLLTCDLTRSPHSLPKQLARSSGASQGILARPKENQRSRETPTCR